MPPRVRHWRTIFADVNVTFMIIWQHFHATEGLSQAVMMFSLDVVLERSVMYQRIFVPLDGATWRTALFADANVTTFMLFWREVSCTSETSCHLTARHGVQLFAGVKVTLHVALERSVVESANSGTSEIVKMSPFQTGTALPPAEAFGDNNRKTQQCCERA